MTPVTTATTTVMPMRREVYETLRIIELSAAGAVAGSVMNRSRERIRDLVRWGYVEDTGGDVGDERSYKLTALAVTTMRARECYVDTKKAELKVYWSKRSRDRRADPSTRSIELERSRAAGRRHRKRRREERLAEGWKPTRKRRPLAKRRQRVIRQHTYDLLLTVEKSGDQGLPYDRSNAQQCLVKWDLAEVRCRLVERRLFITIAGMAALRTREQMPESPAAYVRRRKDDDAEYLAKQQARDAERAERERVARAEGRRKAYPRAKLTPETLERRRAAAKAYMRRYKRTPEQRQRHKDAVRRWKQLNRQRVREYARELFRKNPGLRRQYMRTYEERRREAHMALQIAGLAGEVG